MSKMQPLDLNLQKKIHNTFENTQRISIDIGGSLAKLAYLVNIPKKKTIYTIDGSSSYEIDEIGTQLHFVKFETKCIEAWLDYIQKHIITLPEFKTCKVLKATGGGAYKYIDLIKEKLNFKVEREDEMDCLVLGCNFLLKHIPEEAFYYHKHGNSEYEFQNIDDSNIYPYLLVNIGSGVSILKVESENDYSRIGGTSLGGGTFWGLGSLLTQAKGFDELLALAEKGDHRNVDMLVRDIYGGDYNAQKLPANLIASSFGKTVRRSSVWFPPLNEAELEGITPIYCTDSDACSSSTDYPQGPNQPVSPNKTTSIKDNSTKITDKTQKDAGNETIRPPDMDKIYFEDLNVQDIKSCSLPHNQLVASDELNGLQINPTRQFYTSTDAESDIEIPNRVIYHGASQDANLIHDDVPNAGGKVKNEDKTSARLGLRKNSFTEKLFKEEDIAHSLLIMISNNIGQIAYLNAKHHNLKRIYFAGFFIRGHPITMHTITYAMHFWSKGEVRPLFLRHEGYLGVVGAFLTGLKPHEEANSYSWYENYLGNSQLQNPLLRTMKTFKEPHISKMDFLMFERFEGKLSRFKMLADPENYTPDLEDLTKDSVSRTYWMDLFNNTIERYVDQARASQRDAPDIEDRISKFRHLYTSRINYLSQNIYAYGHLSVRILLDTCLQCLSQCGFNDPYLQEKKRENSMALQELPEYFKKYVIGDDDGNKEPDSRNFITSRNTQYTLMLGILAGNLFDWGSRDILPMLLDNHVLTFDIALKKIPLRPWLIDDFDSWCDALQRNRYKCAAIFVDNSGADLILGVLCLVDRFLAIGTNVILCANSKPSFNDVTYPELKIIVERAAKSLPFLNKAWEDSLLHENREKLTDEDHRNAKLILMETGSGSPCLDFMRINEEINTVFERERVDLLILEGMGRSIHTNLNAAFTCDAIKIAVLKDNWFAERLGGKIFSPVFKFTPKQESRAPKEIA